MASNLYNKGLLKLLDGTIDYLTDNVAILIVSNNYVFDRTQEFVSNISDEISGSGYARKSLTSKTVTLNTTSNVVTFDCGTITYTALDSANVLAAAIIYAETGVDSSSSLIANIDFENLTTSNSDVNIVTSPVGLFEITNIIS